MKSTENNEMDLLLRGLARREGAHSAASEGDSAMHMDADELNSYAEQALPAAARARYTSHLAECASCRKILSELTSASGVNVGEVLVSQKTSGLWQKLAAFFSPGLLRFAGPALALFAFIAVGLVALRQQTQPEFVAVNQPAASRDAIHESKEAASPAQAGDSAVGFTERQSPESATVTDKSRDNLAKSGERNETSKIATPTDSVAVTSDRDASAGKAAGAVAQPSYAPEPGAPPPPKAQTTHIDSQSEVAARQKEEADKKKDEPAREEEVAGAGREDSQNRVASAPAAKLGSAVQSQERSRVFDSKRASGPGEKTNDDEANIRTVSGRRFRRQGGVWIDTAYQSSAATTILTRGSEQFRALVADEPGIRTIASQLPGEVVVVWKGRAYRIR